MAIAQLLLSIILNMNIYFDFFMIIIVIIQIIMRQRRALGFVSKAFFVQNMQSIFDKNVIKPMVLMDCVLIPTSIA